VYKKGFCLRHLKTCFYLVIQTVPLHLQESRLLTNTTTSYSIIIIGGGPIGLACALEAKKQELD
jgi:NADPH-dependent 2,4-dienoyl-CoA reductase/sulfur reductase-like enzyme